MATRRRRREPRAPRALGGVTGPEQTVERDGRPYRVRMIPGQASDRWYVCPLCDERIPAREPHVVAWPDDERSGVEQRRHWHTRCWRRSG